MTDYRRHGDVNLHPITREQYEALQGEVKNHSGSYILAHGEATGSIHEIHVKDKANLEVKDMGDRLALAIQNEAATITHTADHQTIEMPKVGYWIQVPEREVDWFSEGIERKIID